MIKATALWVMFCTTIVLAQEETIQIEPISIEAAVWLPSNEDYLYSIGLKRDAWKPQYINVVGDTSDEKYFALKNPTPNAYLVDILGSDFISERMEILPSQGLLLLGNVFSSSDTLRITVCPNFSDLLLQKEEERCQIFKWVRKRQTKICSLVPNTKGKKPEIFIDAVNREGPLALGMREAKIKPRSGLDESIMEALLLGFEALLGMPENMRWGKWGIDLLFPFRMPYAELQKRFPELNTPVPKNELKTNDPEQALPEIAIQGAATCPKCNKSLPHQFEDYWDLTQGEKE